MKKIKYMLLAFLCVIGLTACQDDLGVEVKNGVDLGSSAVVTLDFGLPHSMEINVSRADNSKSQISDIYLFVFDKSGNYIGESEVTELAPKSSGEKVQYTGKATLYMGTQTVYAVANRLNMEYWNESTFTDLQAEAKKGASQFLQVLYQLNDKIVQGKLPPGFPDERMPLSGQGEITVNAGNQNQVQGIVTLKRMVAQIKFKIHSKYDKFVDGYPHHVTFTPKSYTICNIPQQSSVSENDSEITGGENFYHSITREIGLPTGEEQIAYIDGFYLPENKQQAQKNCTTYNNREEHSADDYQRWTYAPQNGSYVVINGRYTETQDNNGNETLVKYADVSYTIHLGDFGEKDYSDFNVLRNNIYTYTVKVEGVDKIIVEAERKDEDYQHGAEGDVIELTDASKMFNLDAHYEQVYVEYNLSDIARKASSAGEGDLENRIKHNFLLSIHSPMNTVSSDKELVLPYGETVSEEKGMAGIDYRWIEFYSQSEYKTISKYPGEGSPELLSPWTVCQKMGEAVKLLCESNNKPNVEGLIISKRENDYYARFTVFVDEYFYTKDLSGMTVVAWGDFTHKEDRTMMIASNMKISEDNHSTYSTAMTYITQKSIETFYNAQSDHYTNALGVEIYNESGSIVGYGTHRASDWSNGRANMKTDMSWNSWKSWNEYLDWTQIGYTDQNTGVDGNKPGFGNSENHAYLACLSRNRDLNGDGKIQDDEIRWYLPALSQYLRLGIGALSLSAEARLYTGDKSAMTGKYPDDYIDDGALYYHNTKDQGQYWAVEVGSYGTTGAYSGQIRCVRNLPSEDKVVDAGENSLLLVGDEALAGPVYGRLKKITDGNYLFDFGDRLKDDMYRPTFKWGPYSSHHEESDDNHLPHAFVVSKNYTSREYYMEWGWGVGTYDGTDDPCNTYSEKSDESDRGLWRTPNLNELMVMAAGLKDKDAMKEAALCRTKFSNQDVRSGFYYNGNLITANTVKNTDGNYYRNNAKSRCVRDATENERTNAIPIN